MRTLELNKSRRKIKAFTCLATMLLSALLIFEHSVSLAHDGHHGPELAQAQYGGILQTGKKEGALEVVQEGSEIKVYAYDHHMDPVKPKSLTLTGHYKLPREKDENKITFSKGDNYFKATVDAKGAHRYELNLEAIFKVDSESSKETFRFQIEPSK